MYCALPLVVNSENVFLEGFFIFDKKLNAYQDYYYYKY